MNSHDLSYIMEIENEDYSHNNITKNKRKKNKNRIITKKDHKHNQKNKNLHRFSDTIQNKNSNNISEHASRSFYNIDHTNKIIHINDNKLSHQSHKSNHLNKLHSKSTSNYTINGIDYEDNLLDKMINVKVLKSNILREKNIHNNNILNNELNLFIFSYIKNKKKSKHLFEHFSTNITLLYAIEKECNEIQYFINTIFNNNSFELLKFYNKKNIISTYNENNNNTIATVTNTSNNHHKDKKILFKLKLKENIHPNIFIDTIPISNSYNNDWHLSIPTWMHPIMSWYDNDLLLQTYKKRLSYTHMKALLISNYNKFIKFEEKLDIYAEKLLVCIVDYINNKRKRLAEKWILTERYHM